MIEHPLHLHGEEWRQDANCKGVNPELFFPERGDSRTVKAAKAVCAECVVSAECLDFALRYGIKHGIFGGTSERQRRSMRREGAA